jgi:hypothetical protein
MICFYFVFLYSISNRFRHVISSWLTFFFFIFPFCMSSQLWRELYVKKKHYLWYYFFLSLFGLGSDAGEVPTGRGNFKGLFFSYFLLKSIN